VCRSKHVEQLRNIGIINSTTRSHLVGYFYTICIMMHGSMNISLISIRFVLWCMDPWTLVLSCPHLYTLFLKIDSTFIFPSHHLTYVSQEVISCNIIIFHVAWVPRCGG